MQRRKLLCDWQGQKDLHYMKKNSNLGCTVGCMNFSTNGVNVGPRQASCDSELNSEATLSNSARLWLSLCVSKFDTGSFHVSLVYFIRDNLQIICLLCQVLMQFTTFFNKVLYFYVPASQKIYREPLIVLGSCLWIFAQTYDTLTKASVLTSR